MFLIRGALFEAGVYRHGDHDAAQWVVWWKESQLLRESGGQQHAASASSVGAIDGDGNSEDEELMLAIAMSESLS